jgi:hypothetical protein
MMQILVESSTGANPEQLQPLALRADGIVFTRLLRPNQNEPEDFLNAPPAQLAFWLIDNWWRLRFECIPSDGMSADWRLAHETASIGGGYVWPRLAIWGEGERIGLASKSDPSGVVGPVRYLTDALVFIPARAFDEEVDRFLRDLVDTYAGSCSDSSALSGQLEALLAERSDEAVSAWRRMEARLGFDPDDAPDSVIEDLATLESVYGIAGVEEAAMASPGTEAAAILRAEISIARDSRVVCTFDNAVAACGVVDTQSTELPWVTAEKAATTLRAAFGSSGPLRNRALADILGTQLGAFKASGASSKTLPYGLRLEAEPRRDFVAVRSRWSHDRRFEMARALGDAVWAKGDRLGPLALSKTARQKFQRAFAQGLLCPYDDLRAYIGTEDPTDEDLSAAARHFHVSERVVRTALVNKHVIERSRILEPARFEELVEAA